MEPFIHKYVKEVKSYIALNTKDEKSFIKKFKSDVFLSYENEEFHNYDELIDVFGYPNEVAGAYIQTIDTAKITRHMNSKNMIIVFIICIILGIVITYAYDSYRLNKILNDIQEEKDAGRGIYAPSESEGQ